MKTYPLLLFVACLSLVCDEAFPALGSTTSLKLTCPYGYLPANPILVRVEALNAQSQPDRDLWDAEVTLAATGGVSLSPNRITLRNGLGSGLITCSGGGDFTLTATLGTLFTNRPLVTLVAAPVTTFGGTLPGGSTTWSGVVKVTNNLTVPVGLGKFLNSDEAPWNYMMATAIVYALPPVAIYYAFRRRMISGLTMGGVKG